ncbi:metal ABC transporter solute-binding protein, Zn/Mn family [Nitrogeniibacter aestuarii]|uniref:metal ABC transporter solute-binding protein, Zn/Mn family n=1 Tax=Nitrogeniibacter aestuarii TaxID=2815343 RepID=UPI001E481C74|nr:zinc ABC transporter substrate-binding protein [Nitrogeniibacter aestuarii]
MTRFLASLMLCFSLSSTAFAEPALRVLTTFTILQDFVREIGGDRVTVTTLVGFDEDAHAFDPRASDIRRLRDADLLVSNGLGFDPWIDPMMQSARFTGTHVVASSQVTPLERDDEGHDEPGHEHHHDGMADPHAWLDATNAMNYVRTIAAALIAADPAGKSIYEANEAAYLAQLNTLEKDLRAGFASLPPSRRTVVTPHDAFGYFAHAYGLHFLAPAGLSNEAAPSAAAVADLIRQLRELNVDRVYLETLADDRLIQRIGRETGATVGGALYADALSRKDGADTYTGLMRHNLKTLTAP